MKLQTVGATLLLVLSQTSFAIHPKPQKCPSVSALQTVGISYMIKQNDYWYGEVDLNSYGTEDNWNFGIGVFKTYDENLAKQQAIATLKFLKSSSGPIEISDGWLCSYTDNMGHSGVAITPPYN